MAEALASVARTESCGSAEEALEALRRESADLVLADLVLGGPSGLDLLSSVRREQPGTDFVLITGNPSVESAVDALRMGASDYLRKPVDPEELRLVVERVLSSRRIVSENLRLRDELATIEACRALTPCLEPGEVCRRARLLRVRSRYWVPFQRLRRVRRRRLPRLRGERDGPAARVAGAGQAIRSRGAVARRHRLERPVARSADRSAGALGARVVGVVARA